MGAVRVLSLALPYLLSLPSVVNYGGKNVPLLHLYVATWLVWNRPHVCAEPSAFVLPWRVHEMHVAGGASVHSRSRSWSSPGAVLSADTSTVILYKTTCIIFQPFPDAFLIAGLPNAVREFQKFHSLFSSIFKIKAVTYTWGQKQQQNQLFLLIKHRKISWLEMTVQLLPSSVSTSS